MSNGFDVNFKVDVWETKNRGWMGILWHNGDNLHVASAGTKRDCERMLRQQKQIVKRRIYGDLMQ